MNGHTTMVGPVVEVSLDLAAAKRRIRELEEALGGLLHADGSESEKRANRLWQFADEALQRGQQRDVHSLQCLLVLRLSRELRDRLDGFCEAHGVDAEQVLEFVAQQLADDPAAFDELLHVAATRINAATPNARSQA